MNDYVIINGVNSNTISGLKISKLPPITKPQMRTLIETIDGRDGDLITDLGYSAYDKQLEIGLWGTYDINTVISFFNQEGTITFSNEADKFYNFKIINQIDYQKLLKFKTAVVVMHCQPFKYPTTETPIEGTPTTITGEGESITLNNTLEAPLEIDLKGNTQQNGTPTPSTPIDIQVVSGDNEIKVEGKNLFNGTLYNGIIGQEGGYSSATNRITTSTTGTDSTLFLPKGTYTLSIEGLDYCTALTKDSNNNILENFADSWKALPFTFITTQDGYLYFSARKSNNANLTPSDYEAQVEKSNQSTTYVPYVSQTYPIYLGVENLFDKEDILRGYSYNYGSVGEIAVPTANDTRMVIPINKAIPIQPNTTYTLTFPSGFRFALAQLKSDTSSLGDTGWVINTTKYTITTNSNAKYIAFNFGKADNSTITDNEWNTFINSNIQLEKGSKANHYTEYGTTPIELCKIGDYQDRIFKTSGKWYIEKKIGKVVLDGSENWSLSSVSPQRFIYNFGDGYSDAAKLLILSNYFKGIKYDDKDNVDYPSIYLENGYIGCNKTGIDTVVNFKTWLSTHNTIVYYVLSTPTYTKITGDLIGQLNDLEGANSYDNQTNINQTNNDYPFWLSASTTFNAPITINNIGNIYAKPILELEGSGNITINLNSQDILAISLGDTTTKIVIDIPNLEAYNPTDSTLMNRLVVGDYMKFLINSGNNTLKIDGNITSYRLTSYTRWL